MPPSPNLAKLLTRYRHSFDGALGPVRHVFLQNFSADISGMSVDGAFAGQPCQELNKVICEHLFRQGKMDVGESLMKVCVCCGVYQLATPPECCRRRSWS